MQSFAYVFEVLTVLRLVFLPGEDGHRIISFRRANRTEREVYYDWLEKEFVFSITLAAGKFRAFCVITVMPYTGFVLAF